MRATLIYGVRKSGKTQAAYRLATNDFENATHHTAYAVGGLNSTDIRCPYGDAYPETVQDVCDEMVRSGMPKGGVGSFGAAYSLQPEMVVAMEDEMVWHDEMKSYTWVIDVNDVDDSAWIPLVQLMQRLELSPIHIIITSDNYNRLLTRYFESIPQNVSVHMFVTHCPKLAVRKAIWRRWMQKSFATFEDFSTIWKSPKASWTPLDLGRLR